MAGNEDPWVLAWLCSRGRCDIASVSNTIREYLLKPMDSQEYIYALEFLRMYKSEVTVDKIKDLVERIFAEDVTEKLLGDTSPDNVLRYYSGNPHLAMDLLTLWEYLIIHGKIDNVSRYILEILKRLASNIEKNYSQIKDLVEPVIHGPMIMLPMDKLLEIIRAISNYPMRGDIPLFKARVLKALIDGIPPYTILNNKVLMDNLRLMLKQLIHYLLQHIDPCDPLISVVVDEVNVFIESIWFKSVEAGDNNLYKYIIGDLENTIHRVFSKYYELTRSS